MSHFPVFLYISNQNVNLFHFNYILTKLINKIKEIIFFPFELKIFVILNFIFDLKYWDLCVELVKPRSRLKTGQVFIFHGTNRIQS